MAHENPSIFQSAFDRRLRERAARRQGRPAGTAAPGRGPRAGSATSRGRRRLLGNAFKLTRLDGARRCMDALTACQEVLGHEGPVEVFVSPEPTSGPRRCMPRRRLPPSSSPRGSSRCSPEAGLRFIIGHELGHLAFEHFSLPLPATAIAGTFGGSRPPRRAFGLGRGIGRRRRARIGRGCCAPGSSRPPRVPCSSCPVAWPPDP